MPTFLPVPIQFELPESWRTELPDAVGAPGAAFVARHPQPAADFTANITIDGGYRPDEATLSEIAHESVERLRRTVTSVEVLERREFGSAEAPGFSQTLAVSAVVDGVPRGLVQSQVYLSMQDVVERRKRAVIRLVLTATATQFPYVIGDFQDFLRTVRPDTATAS